MMTPAIGKTRFKVRPALLTSACLLLAAFAGPALGCTPGDTACPVVLKMKPSAVTITVNGRLSQQRPSYSFSFAARAGQTVLVHTTGAVLRGQLSLTGPIDPNADDLYQDAPYKLPATGIYGFTCIANTQAENAFGRFQMTLTVK